MSDELSTKEINKTQPHAVDNVKERSRLARVLLAAGVVLGGLGAFVISQFYVAIMLVTLLSAFGNDTDSIDALFDSNVFILSISLLSSAVVIGILWVVCLIAKRRFVDIIGLSRLPKLSDLGWGILGYSAYFVAFAVLAVAVLPLLTNVIDTDQMQDFGVSFDTNPLNIVVLFIMFVVLPPIVEEILFRGFMYRILRKLINKWVALVVVSIVFGFMHLELLSGNPLNWIAMIDTAILSVPLVLLVEKTGSIWSAIFVHALKNFLAYVLLISGAATIL